MMTTQYRKGSVSMVALFCLCALGWGGLPKGDGTVEVRDASGRVRVRLGDLAGDGLGFGFQVFDEAGAVRAAVSCKQAETTLDLVGASVANRVSIGLTEGGASVTMGPREGWQLMVGRNAAGELKATYTKGGVDDESRFALVCRPDGDRQSIFRVYNGRDSALTLGVDKEGAQLEMLQNRVSAARLVAINGVGGRLQLGERNKGVVLQALVDGSSSIDLARERPLLSVQCSSAGVGLAINHDGGNPAVRIGVKDGGNVVDSHWDKEGNEIAPKNGAKIK